MPKFLDTYMQLGDKERDGSKDQRNILKKQKNNEGEVFKLL